MMARTVTLAWVTLSASVASAQTRCPVEDGVAALAECPSREVLRPLLLHFDRLAHAQPVAAVWVAPGRITRGRFRRAETRDVVMTAARLDAISAFRLAQEPELGEGFDDDPSEGGRFAQIGVNRVHVRRAEASFRGEVLVRAGFGEDTETIEVAAELRRVDGVWRLVSLRSWGGSFAIPDELTEYDRAYWNRREAEVRMARRAARHEPGDVELVRLYVEALMWAHRFGEAMRVATQLCAREDADSAAHRTRMDVALVVGDLEAARESAEAALRSPSE